MQIATETVIDPDVRRLLGTLFCVAEREGPPDVAQLRAAAEAAPKLLGGTPEPVASIRDMVVPGPRAGVRVRIYRPASPSPLPLVLFAHGGGWVAGSLDSHDSLCRIFANAFAAVFVAVDYALAPEHKYPAALDDVEAAWRWARANARDVGGDGARFAVAGDSVGANLVAALGLRLARRRMPQPDLQVLLYPALDAQCSRGSFRKFARGYNLTAADMAWFWRAYRGDAAIDPELSPLLAPSLAGVAPAVVAVAGADVLRDEGLDYAKALSAAGVPAQLTDCVGMVHGFLRWTGEVAAARRWIEVIAEAARNAPAGR
jgi:acetyl esterase